jgi:hypothetical protein
MAVHVRQAVLSLSGSAGVWLSLKLTSSRRSRDGLCLYSWTFYSAMVARIGSGESGSSSSFLL